METRRRLHLYLQKRFNLFLPKSNPAKMNTSNSQTSFIAESTDKVNTPEQPEQLYRTIPLFFTAKQAAAVVESAFLYEADEDRPVVVYEEQQHFESTASVPIEASANPSGTNPTQANTLLFEQSIVTSTPSSAPDSPATLSGFNVHSTNPSLLDSRLVQSSPEDDALKYSWRYPLLYDEMTRYNRDMAMKRQQVGNSKTLSVSIHWGEDLTMAAMRVPDEAPPSLSQPNGSYQAQTTVFGTHTEGEQFSTAVIHEALRYIQDEIGQAGKG